MARDYSRQQVLDIIEREAGERRIPRDDFMRFAYIETGGRFDEQASRGEGGAKGLFQFVPSTATQYGIRGRELDAVANTDAAAQLYLDNRGSLTRQHARDDRPYLSGKPQPDGLDMYMAHQQGAAGYRSIQAGIATGHFTRPDTRPHILNNVSGDDLRAITGSSKAQLAAMSDRDMAATFVRYWDTKFDRIRIAEKGIEPIVDGRTPAPAHTRVPAQGPTGAPVATSAPVAPRSGADGIALSAAYALGVRHDSVKYAINVPSSSLYRPGVDGKHLNQGYIDCSGWVSTLENATMKEINAKAGRTVFDGRDLFNPGNDGSGEIVRKAAQRSELLTGAAVRAPGALKEGMVIGVDSGRTAHEHWKGIDHIVMVVRDPKSGELLASQSTGSKGVHTMPLDDYLAANTRTTLFAADPLAKARGLLQAPQLGPQQDAVISARTDGGLTVGQQGPGVKALQQDFMRLGIKDDGGKLLTGTGYFGEHTRQVVSRFQSGRGLEATGIVDAKTMAAIKGEGVSPQSPATAVAAAGARASAPVSSTPPLVTDAGHPSHALFAAISKQLPPGTKPDAIANITMQAMENGITSAAKLTGVSVKGSDVFVVGTMPGERARVDLQAPTAPLTAMSEHMARQTQDVAARDVQIQAPAQSGGASR